MKGLHFVLLLMLSVLIQSKKHFRFKNVKCGTSQKTGIDLKCFLKSYTRKNPVLNGEFTLLRTVPDGLVCEF